MSVTTLPGRVHTRHEHVWGTVVTLDVRDPEATAAVVDATWASVRAELHRIDAVFSTFRGDSVVSLLRRGGTHVVADDVGEVVDRCLEARLLTDGCFDPWAATGGFDPSGLVKGWAADRCAEIVRRHGMRSFSLDAAGDLACRGAATALDDKGWPIGISHPDDSAAIVAVVAMVLPAPDPAPQVADGPFGAHVQVTDCNTAGTVSLMAVFVTVEGPVLVTTIV